MDRPTRQEGFSRRAQVKVVRGWHNFKDWCDSKIESLHERMYHPTNSLYKGRRAFSAVLIPAGLTDWLQTKESLSGNSERKMRAKKTSDVDIEATAGDHNVSDTVILNLEMSMSQIAEEDEDGRPTQNGFRDMLPQSSSEDVESSAVESEDGSGVDYFAEETLTDESVSASQNSAKILGSAEGKLALMKSFNSFKNPDQDANLDMFCNPLCNPDDQRSTWESMDTHMQNESLRPDTRVHREEYTPDKASRNSKADQRPKSTPPSKAFWGKGGKRPATAGSKSAGGKTDEKKRPATAGGRKDRKSLSSVVIAGTDAGWQQTKGRVEDKPIKLPRHLLEGGVGASAQLPPKRPPQQRGIHEDTPAAKRREEHQGKTVKFLQQIVNSDDEETELKAPPTMFQKREWQVTVPTSDQVAAQQLDTLPLSGVASTRRPFSARVNGHHFPSIGGKSRTDEEHRAARQPRHSSAVPKIKRLSHNEEHRLPRKSWSNTGHFQVERSEFSSGTVNRNQGERAKLLEQQSAQQIAGATSLRAKFTPANLKDELELEPSEEEERVDIDFVDKSDADSYQSYEQEALDLPFTHLTDHIQEEQDLPQDNHHDKEGHLEKSPRAHLGDPQEQQLVEEEQEPSPSSDVVDTAELTLRPPQEASEPWSMERVEEQKPEQSESEPVPAQETCIPKKELITYTVDDTCEMLELLGLNPAPFRTKGVDGAQLDELHQAFEAALFDESFGAELFDALKQDMCLQMDEIEILKIKLAEIFNS